MEYIFLIKIKIYQELLIKDTSRDVNNDYTTHMSMLLSIRVLSILLCFTLLCFALLCFALLYFTLLCFALLCFALLCFALLCFVGESDIECGGHRHLIQLSWNIYFPLFSLTKNCADI